jgi:hypothetical protein
MNILLCQASIASSFRLTVERRAGPLLPSSNPKLETHALPYAFIEEFFSGKTFKRMIFKVPQLLFQPVTGRRFLVQRDVISH